MSQGYLDLQLTYSILRQFAGAHNLSIRESIFNAIMGSAYYTVHLPPPPASRAVQTVTAGGNPSSDSTPFIASEVYAQLLLGQKKGYPLWNPKVEGSNHLPLEYKQYGVHIGDVGILNEKGGFNPLFNTCHPQSHPLNIRGVPPNFKVLEIDENDTLESPRAYTLGSHVASDNSFCQDTMSYSEGQIPIAEVPVEFGAGQVFTSSATKGALLILPEGGRSSDHEQRLRFIKHAAEHAQPWYDYVNGLRQLSRGVENGSIYLVTGYDKARVWGMASFKDAQGPVRLDFVSRMSYNAGGPPEFWFQKCHFASAFNDADNEFQNQSGCVFLRGVKIAIRDSWFFNKYAEAAHILDLKDDQGYHPSDVINKWILNNYQEVDVAVTHDDDWASVIENVMFSVRLAGDRCTNYSNFGHSPE
ncbi:hypothetical protein BT96DRAFT_946371 [Gymnopus androsaceus JB14]|uniref:Uncharacterized protein n=1 Tax=Gymnopus androsaceus JB14 TaxID=1447944 RepID=A0A6A4GXR5_9AGAR|nr:hypothetical protein BT96DRAFT_946371 [Gymnopus androsaceus JB14]